MSGTSRVDLSSAPSADFPGRRIAEHPRYERLSNIGTVCTRPVSARQSARSRLANSPRRGERAIGVLLGGEGRKGIVSRTPLWSWLAHTFSCKDQWQETKRKLCRRGLQHARRDSRHLLYGMGEDVERCIAAPDDENKIYPTDALIADYRQFLHQLRKMEEQCKLAADYDAHCARPRGITAEELFKMGVCIFVENILGSQANTLRLRPQQSPLLRHVSSLFWKRDARERHTAVATFVEACRPSIFMKKTAALAPPNEDQLAVLVHPPGLAGLPIELAKDRLDNWLAKQQQEAEQSEIEAQAAPSSISMVNWKETIATEIPDFVDELADRCGNVGQYDGLEAPVKTLASDFPICQRAQKMRYSCQFSLMCLVESSQTAADECNEAAAIKWPEHCPRVTPRHLVACATRNMVFGGGLPLNLTELHKKIDNLYCMLAGAPASQPVEMTCEPASDKRWRGGSRLVDDRCRGSGISIVANAGSARSERIGKSRSGREVGGAWRGRFRIPMSFVWGCRKYTAAFWPMMIWARAPSEAICDADTVMIVFSKSKAGAYS